MPLCFLQEEKEVVCRIPPKASEGGEPAVEAGSTEGKELIVPPKTSESGEPPEAEAGATGATEGKQLIVQKTSWTITPLHVDIIKSAFWKERPHLLGEES